MVLCIVTARAATWKGGEFLDLEAGGPASLLYTAEKHQKDLSQTGQAIRTTTRHCPAFALRICTRVCVCLSVCVHACTHRFKLG